MASHGNVMKRRVIARSALIICIVALGFLMYVIGHEFDVILDNGTVSIDGAEYAAVEYGTVVIDGDERRGTDVWADDRIIKKMIGVNHRLTIKVLDPDDDSVIKSVELPLKLDFNTREMMISLAAVASESSNVLTPNPNYSAAVAVPSAPDTPQPSAPGEPGDAGGDMPGIL
jgi:hypothetical protein